MHGDVVPKFVQVMRSSSEIKLVVTSAPVYEREETTGLNCGRLFLDESSLRENRFISAPPGTP